MQVKSVYADFLVSKGCLAGSILRNVCFVICSVRFGIQTGDVTKLIVTKQPFTNLLGESIYFSCAFTHLLKCPILRLSCS